MGVLITGSGTNVTSASGNITIDGTSAGTGTASTGVHISGTAKGTVVTTANVTLSSTESITTEPGISAGTHVSTVGGSSDLSGNQNVNIGWTCSLF